jgi:hypothetical protein
MTRWIHLGSRTLFSEPDLEEEWHLGPDQGLVLEHLTRRTHHDTEDAVLFSLLRYTRNPRRSVFGLVSGFMLLHDTIRLRLLSIP